MEPGVPLEPRGAAAQEALSAPRRAREPRVLDLVEPVQFGSELITRLTLQPINGRMMRGVSLPKPGQITMAYFLELASLASGHPDAVFDRLCPEDVLAVVNEVAAMVGPSAGTSDKA